MSEFEENKQQRRANVFNEKYSHERLSALKRLISNQNQQGIRRDYSLSIDGETVIPRTSDPMLFDLYQRYLEPHTKTIEVRLYFGDSPNSNLYIFDVATPVYGPALGSLPTAAPAHQEERVELMMDKKDLEKDLLFAQAELKRYKKKVKKYKKSQGESGGGMKDLILSGLEVFKQYATPRGGPQPALQAPQQREGFEDSVHIEPERTSRAERRFQSLKESLSEKQLDQIIAAWSMIAKHPDIMAKVAQLLESKNQENGKSQVQPDN